MKYIRNVNFVREINTEMVELILNISKRILLCGSVIVCIVQK